MLSGGAWTKTKERTGYTCCCCWTDGRHKCAGSENAERAAGASIMEPQLSALSSQHSALSPQPSDLSPLPSALDQDVASGILAKTAPAASWPRLPPALSPQPSALSPQPAALSPQLSALNTQHSALSPQPSDLSPQPSAPRVGGSGVAVKPVQARTGSEFMR